MENKTFCIGYNKSGTTSLSELFRKEVYKIAPQRPFECLLDEYISGDTKHIVNVIKDEYNDCDFFQDVPFSLPKMFVNLDTSFPDAKFILTYRDSAEKWYESYIRFMKLIQGSIDEPYNFSYVRIGWILEVLVRGYGTTIGDPFNKEKMIESYKNHIQECEQYFKNKSNFIKINLSDQDDFKRLQFFLKKDFKSKEFPHINKSI